MIFALRGKMKVNVSSGLYRELVTSKLNNFILIGFFKKTSLSDSTERYIENNKKKKIPKNTRSSIRKIHNSIHFLEAQSLFTPLFIFSFRNVPILLDVS